MRISSRSNVRQNHSLIVGRNIASNARGPGESGGEQRNSNTTNPGSTTMNTRTVHFNESGKALTNIALVYCGWTMHTTAGEVAIGNDYTVTASIEYPVGTFTQLTWSGSSTGTVINGTNLVSDYVNVAIPAGAAFNVRTFCSCTSGSSWPGTDTLSSGETGSIGIGISDLTMGGTISGSYQGNRPAGILSVVPSGMKRMSIISLGDSIIAGAGDGISDPHGQTGWAARASTGLTPHVRCSVIGTQLAQQIGTMARRLDLIHKIGITHAIVNWGINDGTTQAVKLANIAIVAGYLQGIGVRVFYTTLTPNNSGGATTNWTTVASQTAGSNNSTVNAALRGVPYPLTAVIDNSTAISTSPDSGIWMAGNSQTPYLQANTDTWTVVGSSSTTTSVVSDCNKSFNYYFFGSIKFLTGALAGSGAFINGGQSGGTFTFTGALSQAPAAGDTFSAIPTGAAATGDGLHPNIIINNSIGGHIVLAQNAVPFLQQWNLNT